MQRKYEFVVTYLLHSKLEWISFRNIERKDLFQLNSLPELAEDLEVDRSYPEPRRRIKEDSIVFLRIRWRIWPANRRTSFQTRVLLLSDGCNVHKPSGAFQRDSGFQVGFLVSLQAKINARIRWGDNIGFALRWLGRRFGSGWQRMRSQREILSFISFVGFASKKPAWLVCYPVLELHDISLWTVNLYPNLSVVHRILTTLPVTVESRERGFL